MIETYILWSECLLSYFLFGFTEVCTELIAIHALHRAVVFWLAMSLLTCSVIFVNMFGSMREEDALHFCSSCALLRPCFECRNFIRIL